MKRRTQVRKSHPRRTDVLATIPEVTPDHVQRVDAVSAYGREIDAAELGRQSCAISLDIFVVGSGSSHGTLPQVSQIRFDVR